MWLPFFHRNLDYCETIGYHSGDFFSRGGVIQRGHGDRCIPVGLPHGPQPAALEAFMDGPPAPMLREVGIMADFANPARISDFALGLSRPDVAVRPGLSRADYMESWGRLYDRSALHVPREAPRRGARARTEGRPRA